jgi:Rrf2 family iron-sulfur cluster assembly transcriptional regulator
MFSKTTEYAIRATIYIAQKGTIDNKLGIEKISKAVDSPKSFTSKILQLLAGENITKKAMALPVRALLEIFGEDDIFNKCVMGLKNCSDKKPCPMHAQYKPIKEQLINIFEKKTIGELAADITNGTTFIKN